MCGLRVLNRGAGLQGKKKHKIKTKTEAPCSELFHVPSVEENAPASWPCGANMPIYNNKNITTNNTQLQHRK